MASSNRTVLWAYLRKRCNPYPSKTSWLGLEVLRDRDISEILQRWVSIRWFLAYQVDVLSKIRTCGVRFEFETSAP